MIRRDGNYHDNVAELIRSILPRSLYRLVRCRRGYELVWQGTQDMFQRLLLRLPLTVIILRTVSRGHGLERNRLTPPYDALLEQAVEALPILNGFRQEEGRGGQPPVPAESPDNTVPPPPEANLVHQIDEVGGDEVERPVRVTPAVPPAAVAAEIATRVQGRREEPGQTTVAFRSEGALRFAAELVRARRGHECA